MFFLDDENTFRWGQVNVPDTMNFTESGAESCKCTLKKLFKDTSFIQYEPISEVDHIS